MFYLLLSIICSTCLLVVFKYIERCKLETLPVVVVNYFVCGVVGALNSETAISFSELAAREWWFPAIALGMLFVSIFYTVAVSTQINGVATTAVAFKLSVAIPVIAAFYLYGDRFTFLKIAGIVLALVAIFLTSRDGLSAKTTAKGFVSVLPFIVFFGSGVCDTAFNYIQQTFLAENDYDAFLGVLFVTAGSAGLILLFLRSAVKHTMPGWKSIPAGILLGIPNYGSAYFMILALERTGLESSAVWPLNNIGIILLSTAVAALLFREHVSRSGMAGVLLAVISILLIGGSALS